MDAAALKAMTYGDLVEMNHNIGIELLLRSRQLVPTPVEPIATNGHFLPTSDQWTHPPFFQPTLPAQPSPPKAVKSLQRIVKVWDVCAPNTPYTLNGVKMWTLLRAEIIKILGPGNASYRTYVNVKHRYVKLYFEDTVKSAKAYNILRPKYGRVTFLSEAEDKSDEESSSDDDEQE